MPIKKSPIKGALKMHRKHKGREKEVYFRCGDAIFAINEGFNYWNGILITEIQNYELYKDQIK